MLVANFKLLCWFECTGSGSGQSVRAMNCLVLVREVLVEVFKESMFVFKSTPCTLSCIKAVLGFRKSHFGRQYSVLFAGCKWECHQRSFPSQFERIEVLQFN
jgi:hypothetical protein